MAMTQYRPTTDPFSPLFDEIFGGMARGSRMQNMLRAPEAEVVETDREIRVAMDMPGFEPGELDISLENNVLTVSGERRSEWSESEERDAVWHLSERRYGKFSRSFVLPRDVEQDSIEASFENGVLQLRVPKSERVRRRKIEVKPGSGEPNRVQVGQGSEG